MAASGRVVIFVVGFEARDWHQHSFGSPEHTVDVRRWMPRDPAARQQFRKQSLVDYIVSQDGFVAATAAAVQCCVKHARCICGCKAGNHRSPVVAALAREVLLAMGHNVAIMELSG